MAKSRIGVIGSGDVGQVLGAGFAAQGHEVKLGSREPQSDKLKKWLDRAGKNASTGTFAETAKFGEVIILATNWSGTRSAIELAGPDNLAGKVLLDAVNPLDFSKGAPRLAIGFETSAGEQVQKWAPRARVVKAFNIVGNPHMVNPKFPTGTPDMFIAGDDDAAKKTASELIAELGWPKAIDLGGLEQARLLEPLAMVWIQYFVKYGTGTHAFALLRK